MKKSELKQINAQLIDAYAKTQQAWAMVRVLAHAAQFEEPPPPWAVRDTCSAIEDLIGDISILLFDSGATIEGDL